MERKVLGEVSKYVVAYIALFRFDAVIFLGCPFNFATIDLPVIRKLTLVCDIKTFELDNLPKLTLSVAFGDVA